LPEVCLMIQSQWRPALMLKKSLSLAAAVFVFGALSAIAVAPAWAISNDVEIRHLGPNGEDLSNPGLRDDRILAVLAYERPESMQSCGSPKSAMPVSMTMTVLADGNYSGVVTTSQLDCKSKKRGVVRKAAVMRHGGRLASAALDRFWDKLTQLSPLQRDLAGAGEDDADFGTTRIQRSKDRQGVISKRELEETVQTGSAAIAGARFMQSFMTEGKMN